MQCLVCVFFVLVGAESVPNLDFNMEVIFMKLSDKAYDVLKWVAVICLPALATLIGVIFPTWNIPHSDQIVTTINAVSVCIGAMIGLSTAKYNKEA